MKLPGTGSAAGKAGWIAAAVAVTALCIWQATRTLGRSGIRVAQFNVACDACGHYELACDVPFDANDKPVFPAECPKCGEPKAYMAVACPSCREPIPVDMASPPTRCKRCGASLEGMFQPLR